MKADNVKQFFVYANVTFIIVAGFYVLYQLSTNASIDPARAQQLGTAAIFSGFVGMAIQFITGSEIATRATRSAVAAFGTGATASTPTVTAQSPTSMTVTPTPAAPAEPVEPSDG